MTPVVKISQIRPGGFLQPWHAVKTLLQVKVGPEIGAQGQLERKGGLRSRPSQRTFGGNVHDVGSAPAPQVRQGLAQRQPDTHPPVG